MEFGWDRGAFSAALAMYMLIAAILSIITGRLSDKHGPRLLAATSGILGGIGLLLLSQVNSLWQVFLIWGIILSIANSCCSIPILSTIARWFARRGGLAVGLTATGYGLGHSGPTPGAVADIHPRLAAGLRRPGHNTNCRHHPPGPVPETQPPASRPCALRGRQGRRSQTTLGLDSKGAFSITGS